MTRQDKGTPASILAANPKWMAEHQSNSAESVQRQVAPGSNAPRQSKASPPQRHNHSGVIPQHLPADSAAEIRAASYCCPSVTANTVDGVVLGKDCTARSTISSIKSGRLTKHRFPTAGSAAGHQRIRLGESRKICRELFIVDQCGSDDG